MINYNNKLIQCAKNLRKNMTEAEAVLWHKIRRKQVLGVQFYRQKPLLQFVVDFYAPTPGIIIEADGSQHLEAENIMKDYNRDLLLMQNGLKILRYSNVQILQELNSVLQDIYNHIRNRVSHVSMELKKDLSPL